MWHLNNVWLLQKSQESMLQNIIAPATVWTADTSKEGFMLFTLASFTPNSTSNIMSKLNWESFDQVTSFQFVFISFWWACMNLCFSFVFLTSWSGPQVFMCCSFPSSFRLSMVFVQRWYSSCLCCNKWILSFYYFSVILNQPLKFPFYSQFWCSIWTLVNGLHLFPNALSCYSVTGLLTV